MVKIPRHLVGFAVFAGLAAVTLVSGCGGSRPAPATGQVLGSVTLASDENRTGGALPTGRLASSSMRVAPLQSAPNAGDEDSDGVLVKFRPTVSASILSSTARSLGVVREDDHLLTGVKLWRVDASRSIAETVRQLRSRPDVEYAEPNRRIYLLAVPNDPEYAAQWNLPLISLPAAWDVTTGDSSAPPVVVAIIDSGIRLHPDLDPDPSALFRPRDFVDNDSDPTDTGSSVYSFSHGTHVAGTVGALTDNSLGVAGVGWHIHIRLMPLRVAGPSGTTTEAQVAAAVRYAADNGAQVVNMSLGFTGACGPTLSDALVYAHDRGVTLVAAAGNWNPAVSAPANHPDVIAVGAVNSLNERSSYSNYGPELDLVAPGGDGVDRNNDRIPEDILSTTYDFAAGRPAYAWACGTSMAAPHVTGVVALMIASGIRDPETIRTILRNTATDLGRAGRDDYYGYGLVNAQGALGVLARVKVLLGAESVEAVTMPNADGSFAFQGLAVGTRYLAAWRDTDGDRVLDAGDYYAELPAPVVLTKDQMTAVLPSLTLSVVAGSPAVSDRFRAAVGL